VKLTILIFQVIQHYAGVLWRYGIGKTRDSRCKVFFSTNVMHETQLLTTAALNTAKKKKDSPYRTCSFTEITQMNLGQIITSYLRMFIEKSKLVAAKSSKTCAQFSDK